MNSEGMPLDFFAPENFEPHRKPRDFDERFHKVTAEIHAYYGKLETEQCRATSKSTGQRCESRSMAYVDVKGRCYVHAKNIPGSKEDREENSRIAKLADGAVKAAYAAWKPEVAWEKWKRTHEAPKPVRTLETAPRRVVRRKR